MSLPLRLAGLAFLLSLATTPVAAADGAAIYKRCAACHLASGAGVPAAFPPLGKDFRELATKAAGRRYLALVVIKGLAGPISVEGKPYRGIMPAQSGLDDESVAAVLNHVGGTIAKNGPAFKPFDKAEIAAARASGLALKAADVARLHAEVGGK